MYFSAYFSAVSTLIVAYVHVLECITMYLSLLHPWTLFPNVHHYRCGWDKTHDHGSFCSVGKPLWEAG